LAASALLLIFAMVTSLIPRPSEIYPARTSFADYPMELGPWHGRLESMEGVYLDALKLDDYLMADYVNAEGRSVNLYIAYYNSQRKGEAVHSPRSCLPGGGWQMQGFSRSKLQGTSVGGTPLEVNRALITLGDRRELVYYWFQQRGRVITNEFAVKWYLFWDALTRHRTDGALVRLIAPVPPGSDRAVADHELTDMVARIAPTLPRYVPN
jgi:EpsI family protein